MKDKKNVLYSLIIILSGVLYVPVRAQQKNEARDVVYQLDLKKANCFGRRLETSITGLYYLIWAPLATLTPAARPVASSV
ncbi:hypothetical protein [Hufsiella ginkgonis]|uniref:Uncharacterized protein n=1 Tax=Hufsiella ginkgonis TaxID=2695274 RepID=A0A7K1XVL5_9SPHI|nr:hypothetical protein [Hufsiella ginkgonis]MXV15045.1 hypothetical protein [Hufsiella ginkgonis]